MQHCIVWPMSLLQKVAYNTVLQLLGKGGGTALGFIASLIMFRYLEDEKFGNYTTAITYLQLFGIVMDLGLYVVLLKYIGTAKNQSGRLWHNIFTMRLCVAVFFLIIACISVWFIPTYPAIVKLGVLVLAVNFLCISLNQLLLGVYQSAFAIARVAVAEIIGKSVLLLTLLAVVYLWHGSLLLVMAAVVTGAVVQMIVLLSGLRRHTTLKLAFDFSVWRQLFKESWPIALAIALNLIYFKADTLILAFYHSQTIVGIYGAPYKMLEVLISIPAMISGLLLPVLSEHFAAGHQEKFEQLYQRSLNFLLMFALPMVIGTMVLAQPIMLAIAGEDFTSQPAVLGKLLRILIVAAGMIFVGTLTGYVVVVINRQRNILFGYGFVAITALLGYLIFIPPYSYYGAAWVTVYSETMMTLIAGWLIYRFTGARPGLIVPLKILFASTLMGITVWWLRDWPIWLIIPAGAIIYGVVLLASRGITLAEIKSVLKPNIKPS